MPIRFRCESCQHRFSIGRRKVGIEIACCICHHLQKVPDLANREPFLISGMMLPPSLALPPTQFPTREGTRKTRRTTEVVARLVSLTLAPAMLGLVGWLMWIFPNPSPSPSGQRPPSEEQLASVAQVNPLPLLQPEVEVSSREGSAPLSSRPPPPAPPAAAKNRPPDPPPVLERRPPDLPPPAWPAKDIPKKKPPPNTNQAEADSLGEELVTAASERQEALLEQLRKGKGSEYSGALVAAIGELKGEAKEKVRQTLANRLKRFTPATLLAYLGNESPELRCAAALALGMKDDKDHISELIDLLDDPESSVVRAAHVALERLTGRDFAPASKVASNEHADARPARIPDVGEQTSRSRHPMPTAEGKPPARDSQAAKPKQPKKDDDLPDTSLVPPEDASPAVKAIIRANVLALHSKRASERIQAARVLGGLAEEGKPVRRFLCGAMLDPVIAVRVAAADALKNIDPKMHYLAVVLATEKVATGYDANRVVSLLKKIQKQEDDGEPLAPLVAFTVKFAASNGADALLLTALETLSHIGRKDLSSYKVIATALANRDRKVREVALKGLTRMKHGKLAVARILALLKVDTPANRIVAIETLTVLADESTEEIIADAIAAQRYYDDKEVRRAVETALNKLENKQNP